MIISCSTVASIFLSRSIFLHITVLSNESNINIRRRAINFPVCFEKVCCGPRYCLRLCLPCTVTSWEWGISTYKILKHEKTKQEIYMLVVQLHQNHVFTWRGRCSRSYPSSTLRVLHKSILSSILYTYPTAVDTNKARIITHPVLRNSIVAAIIHSSRSATFIWLVSPDAAAGRRYFRRGP